jgi:hypothetical protein
MLLKVDSLQMLAVVLCRSMVQLLLHVMLCL